MCVMTMHGDHWYVFSAENCLLMQNNELIVLCVVVIPRRLFLSLVSAAKGRDVSHHAFFISGKSVRGEGGPEERLPHTLLFSCVSVG